MNELDDFLKALKLKDKFFLPDDNKNIKFRILPPAISVNITTSIRWTMIPSHRRRKKIERILQSI